MADTLHGYPQAFLHPSWLCKKPTYLPIQKRSVDWVQSPLKRGSSAALFTTLLKHDVEASTFNLSANNKHSVLVLVTKVRSKVMEVNCYSDKSVNLYSVLYTKRKYIFTKLSRTGFRLSHFTSLHSSFTNNNKSPIFDVTQSLQFKYVKYKPLPTASTYYGMLTASVTNGFEEDVRVPKLLLLFLVV